MNPTPYNDSNVATGSYTDKVPADARGYIHSIAGAAFVLLSVLGWMNSSEVAVFFALAIAAIDLVLVLYYTTEMWRKALYPVLYAGGGVLVLLGVFNEMEVQALLGVFAAVLGTQVAAAKTPTVIEGSVAE